MFGVSEILVLSSSTTSPFLRVAKVPRGPTMTFRITEYSLIHDITKISPKPQTDPLMYTDPPFVVLNNFSSQDKEIKLMAQMFQNLFPPLNVTQVFVFIDDSYS